MDFVAVVDQVIALLHQRGRVAYPTLKRQFQLDDEALEDLKIELIDSQRLATDEQGTVLVWSGTAVVPPRAPVGSSGTAGGQSPLAYTPPYLAEKILTSRSALEGERKQVTVLFADLKGSMELLADRDPEEARQLLDPVLERMIEAVHRYEGTVNQVMGDGIMALFGAPLAHEDHAVRACYAALRMQAAVQQYATAVQRTHGVPLHMRVGLNAGEVVVRSIGSDLHMDYTAVGQTTHLAARMEQMAMPGATPARAAVVPAQPRQPQRRWAAGGQRRRGRVGRRAKGLSFSYTLDAFDDMSGGTRWPQPVLYYATDEEKIAALADADFLLIHPGDISDAVLRSAKHLKLVQLLRVGYERVNLDLLRALRIPFAITSDAFSGMVADHAVMLMLAVSRHLMASDRGVRAGHWYQPLVGKRSYEMEDKVVGIVGLGHIGRQVAQRVQGFGCRVQYYGHHPLSPEDERALDVRAVSLPALFATSDIVSLHVPITPLTRRMVGAAELRLMQPSAILVNTSRGEVIDEPALIAALKAHALAGAGLDVFDPQPPVADNPLLQMDNVVLTPHSASDTVERWSRTARFVWRNVALVRDGGTPVGLITA